jgi:outer membrane protein assembly factor BamD (BamD/ComL family)
MYKFTAILMCSVVVLCGCSTTHERYVAEEQGQGTLRATFDKKMETPAAQWEYARTTQNNGWLRKADRRMLYLVRRWPNSQEAPWAARARADLLFAQGELTPAFEAYQFLIDNYSSRMANYDDVLESQFEIASQVMNQRRMRWLFGGFRAPEYAIGYFEAIIRNGPQWERAAEAQFLIGRCYQENDEYEMAISAFGLMGYRYPASRFAEEAAWQQIVNLGALREEYPNSPEMKERLLTATTVFISTFPSSKHYAQIREMRNELYGTKAGDMFDLGSFYANVPKKPTATIIYDKALIEEYPKSSLVPQAEERISTMEELLARPEEETVPLAPRSKPLPFG